MAQSRGVAPPVTMHVRPRACQRPGAPQAGAAPPTASGNSLPGCCSPGLGVSAVRSGGDAPDCSAASTPFGACRPRTGPPSRRSACYVSAATHCLLTPAAASQRLWSGLSLTRASVLSEKPDHRDQAQLCPHRRAWGRAVPGAGAARGPVSGCPRLVAPGGVGVKHWGIKHAGWRLDKCVGHPEGSGWGLLFLLVWTRGGKGADGAAAPGAGHQRCVRWAGPTKS